MGHVDDRLDHNAIQSNIATILSPLFLFFVAGIHVSLYLDQRNVLGKLLDGRLVHDQFRVCGDRSILLEGCCHGFL